MARSRRRWTTRPWDIPGPRRRTSPWRRITAPQWFVGSFAALIGVGTLGLKLIPGLCADERIGWLDALFTMTSAVCVTGLVVVDTDAFFSPAGQAWILLFIQLGGLGILTFTTLLTFALGGRLSLRHEELAQTVTDVAPHVNMRRLTRDIVLFTLAIEFAGALVLFTLWTPAHGAGEAAWQAVFHSVSAFCNAGFSTLPDNLLNLRTPQYAPSLIIIGILFVAGGLGFIALEELYLIAQARRRGDRRPPHLSLHSRLVLATTGALVLLGWICFLALEWEGALRGMPDWLKVVHAWFMSITPRTAGFNTVDYAQTRDATNFLTILLMTVGGSPGSTAGGLKTTTFALIILLAVARVKRHEVASAFGRSVPEETVQRAVGLAVGCLSILLAAVLVLTLTEDPAATGDDRFLKYMFECSSAFNTVGLSMGITENLTPPGKWLIILLMFVGRVGPATAAAALALGPRAPQEEFRFSYEEVAIG